MLYLSMSFRVIKPLMNWIKINFFLRLHSDQVFRFSIQKPKDSMKRKILRRIHQNSFVILTHDLLFRKSWRNLWLIKRREQKPVPRYVFQNCFKFDELKQKFFLKFCFISIWLEMNRCIFRRWNVRGLMILNRVIE